ncbi:hypothetical protein SELR_09110 [Selenomonas ruminantium subsp. lactilytica TAM6421]|uniref:Uncharacterized protein n=1 Tax=Selenomonas ruminantium subsp. lactilytica (strain NBRC 103574 / TAM6421) TaxID=927704 RepID=I0GPD2_SELRL|nr:hypothetical protein SELR_09110 [Selenomonas ruminantium subsp. lactilytica TAM6421]
MHSAGLYATILCIVAMNKKSKSCAVFTESFRWWEGNKARD